MKKILGLDLGTTSIGWAFINEATEKGEESEIIKLGVRISSLDNFDTVDKLGKVSESKDPIKDFGSGKGLSPNAGRTQKRGMRRNLDRYKQRRAKLLRILVKSEIISASDSLNEYGKGNTFETLRLRNRAVTEQIELVELARVLLAINKKRGYKSNRKADQGEDGQLIDGMPVARELFERDLTPGQFCLELLSSAEPKKKVRLPKFYRSDLSSEFDAVWAFQKEFYPHLLKSELHESIKGNTRRATLNRLYFVNGEVDIPKPPGKGIDGKITAYQWRSRAINSKLSFEKAAYVLADINGDLSGASGYLGSISDRSKELYFNNLTVGQYLYRQIEKNKHTSLKSQVFYRQDYMDEFDKIWQNQKQFYPLLNAELKSIVRNDIIFHQRNLKSQKGLIAFCEFESKKKVVKVDGVEKEKTIGSRAIPKSSHLFQEFKIWQNIFDLRVFDNESKEQFSLDLEDKELIFKELSIKGKMKGRDVLKVLYAKPNRYKLNFKEVQGNETNSMLYSAFMAILDDEGYSIDMKKSASSIIEMVGEIFSDLGINTDILKFDASIGGKAFIEQASYQFWHLLYSYDGDGSKTGLQSIKDQLISKFGFKEAHTNHLLGVSFQDDYGSLSAKAIRKILPYLRDMQFSDACSEAGYNHSHSLTKEENEKRLLNDRLALLPKNSLRNPVVEKMLNQLVHVVNAIMNDPSMGRPDEIRVELARELKKSAKERQEMTTAISDATKHHEKIKDILRDEFGIMNPSRNDLIRFKLYQELKGNGYHALYSGRPISPKDIFSKEIDIEHIIPKALIYDDSFSNKTLEFRDVNLKKGAMTAIEFLEENYSPEHVEQYVLAVESLFKKNDISKGKMNKLLKRQEDIDGGFIERDIRETQYISKKASQILLEVSRDVTATTGRVTDRLREDWGLINIMKELNLEKYRNQGLVEIEERRNGRTIEKIQNWTKRNDHRHHAMDALTVAFTSHSHIQYLNYLNARRNENHKLHYVVNEIQKKIINPKDGKFQEPMTDFRVEVKKHLDSILISQKARNKVMTWNVNKTKGSRKNQRVMTPRGQMHKETVYGAISQYQTKLVKVGPKFDEEAISTVASKDIREALLTRLNEYGANPKKAFGGKNAISKNPIITQKGNEVSEKVKVIASKTQYTIRKNVDKELKLDKVIDQGVKRILIARLAEFDGDAKEAFSNLEENPIWLNKEKGIQIKRVKIRGVNNAEPLHHARDHFGQTILDKDGLTKPVDFVSTGNNHHAALYIDKEAKGHIEVISFYEAVERINQGLPAIQTEHPVREDWKFMYTIKKNEYFVFPDEESGFDPKEIDLLDESKAVLISPNLFRVQKFGASGDFWFRHHLETTLAEGLLKGPEQKDFMKKSRGKQYNQITSALKLLGLVKVRVNHLGKIIHVGEEYT
jgi:CRISPR-associated endonuclease Csn1